ncbi:MAG: DUF4252 domain-containing protein [Bacteroidota bacterium]
MHKKLVLIFVAAFLAICAPAQKSASDRLYSKLEGADGVMIISIPKDIFSTLEMIFDEDDEKELMGRVERLRLMVCRKETAGSSVGEIRKTFARKPFERAHYEGTKGDVFVVRSGRKRTECHIMNTNQKRLFVLSFYGDFRSSDIEKMINEADDVP